MKFLTLIPIVTAIWTGSVVAQSDLPFGPSVGQFVSLGTQYASNFANYTSQIVDGDRNDEILPSQGPLLETSTSIVFMSLINMVIYDFIVVTARDDNSNDAQDLQHNLTSIIQDTSTGLDNLKNKASVIPKAGSSIVANLKVYDSTVHYLFSTLEVIFPNDKTELANEETALRQKVTDALKALGDSKATRTSFTNPAEIPQNTNGPNVNGTVALSSVSATATADSTISISTSSSGSAAPKSSSAASSTSDLAAPSNTPSLKAQPSSGTATSAPNSSSASVTGQTSDMTAFQVTVITTVAPTAAIIQGRRRSWNNRARQV